MMIYQWAQISHLLGKQTDASIAEILGCSRERVGQVRKGLSILVYKRQPSIPKEAIPLLGKHTDGAIGERFRVHNCTVGKWRKLLNISRFPPRKGVLEIDLSHCDFTQSNGAIAKQEGVHFQTVLRYRLRHDIPPHTGWYRNNRKKKL